MRRASRSVRRGPRRIRHLAASAGRAVEVGERSPRDPARLHPVGRRRHLPPLVIDGAPQEHDARAGGVDRVDEAQAALRGAGRPGRQDVGERLAEAGQQRVGRRARGEAVPVQSGDHHDLVAAPAQRREVVDLQPARAPASRATVVRSAMSSPTTPGGSGPRGRRGPVPRHPRRRRSSPIALARPASAARAARSRLSARVGRSLASPGAAQGLPAHLDHRRELGPRALPPRGDQPPRRCDRRALPAAHQLARAPRAARAARRPRSRSTSSWSAPL